MSSIGAGIDSVIINTYAAVYSTFLPLAIKYFDKVCWGVDVLVSLPLFHKMPNEGTRCFQNLDFLLFYRIVFDKNTYVYMLKRSDKV